VVRLTAIFLCALLSGCVTAQEQEEQAAARRAKVTCEGFGYGPGTPQMLQFEQRVCATQVRPRRATNERPRP
jgi:hypothetical protein